MLTSVDLDGAQLEAAAKARRWRLEFEQQFHRPLVMAEMVKGMLTLPAEAQDSYRAMDVEGFELVKKKVARMKGMMG